MKYLTNIGLVSSFISLPKYWSGVAKMADHKQKQQNADCRWQTVRHSLN